MPIATSRAFDALRAAIEKIEAGGRAPKDVLPFGLEVLDQPQRSVHTARSSCSDMVSISRISASTAFDRAVSLVSTRASSVSGAADDNDGAGGHLSAPGRSLPDN